MSEKPNRTVHVKLSRKIGNDTIELNVSSFAEAGDVGFTFNSLFGELRSALHDYYQNVAPTMPNDPSAGMSDGQQWIDIERLSVSVDKGKRFVKAHGGKFEKYGIVIWPEVAKKIGLDLSIIPDSGYVPHKPLHALVGVDGPSGKMKIIALKVGE